MKLFILITILIASGCWSSVELSSERATQFAVIFDNVLSLKKDDQVFLSKIADSCGLDKTHKKRVEIFACLNNGAVLGDSNDSDLFLALLREHGVDDLASIVPLPFGSFLDVGELSLALDEYLRAAKQLETN